MSRSELQRFAICPSKWKRGWPEEQSDALDFGSLVDCLALTPERFESTYTIQPDTYQETGMKCEGCGSITDSRKCAKCKRDRIEVTFDKPWNNLSETCREWRKAEEANGKSIVHKDDVSEAWKAVKRLQEDRRIAELFDVSKRQVQICVDYHDAETGIVVPVKCLVDLMPDAESIGDLKTTMNADKSAWQRQAIAKGYHVQAALYLDATNAVSDGYTLFLWAIVENVPPYEVGRRWCTDDLLKEGRFAYFNALRDYCYCLKTGEFPGYDDRDPSRGILDGWSAVDVAPWMVKYDV